MSIIKMIGFSGELPSLNPRVLPDQAAKIAFNTRLNDGGLTPFNVPSDISQLPLPVAGYKTLYNNNGSWLAWESEVNVVNGPVDQNRLYITGDGVPKLQVGDVTYPLAVPAPSVKLTPTLSGTATSELGSDRLYVYTFVTSLGEESEPCDISDVIYWKPSQTITLSGFQAAPAGTRITKQRIYRAQTSTTGTQLYFIAERDASTANFVDNLSTTDINEPLPSLNWTMPVDTLQGITAMPNGLMAAFSGRDIYFCEPFIPHAWPVSYSLSVDYDIVGLGAFGSSLAVLTKGNPYVISGTAPDSMVMEKLEINLPCVSSRGIQDLGYSIIYPSQDGLVSISSSGATLITKGLYSREDWFALNPSSIHSGQFNGRYFAKFSRTNIVTGRPISETLIFDSTGEQPFVIKTDINADTFFYDKVQGKLFFVDFMSIREWDAQDKPPMTQLWRSKEFILPKPCNFGAILIEADDGLTDEEKQIIQNNINEIIAINQDIIANGDFSELNATEINYDEVNSGDTIEYPEMERNIMVNVYADDALVARISKVNKMARLPSGFLAKKWEIEVSGNMPVIQILMAKTGTEMATA